MASDKQIRVRVTREEEAEIRSAAERAGFRYPAEFLRVAGLSAARNGGHGKIGGGGPHKTEYVRADIADDILKALENLRACIMDTRGPDAYAAMKAADAAIAKAKGQDT